MIRNDDNDLHRSLGCILAQWLWHQMLISASTSLKAQALLLMVFSHVKLRMGFLGLSGSEVLRTHYMRISGTGTKNAFTICLCPSTHSLLQVQVQLRTLTALWHSRPKPGNWDSRPVAKVDGRSASWWMQRDAITNLDDSGLVVMMISFGFCAAISFCAQESHHTGQLPRRR